VLTRTMKKIEQKVGGRQRKVRDRKRSVRKRVIAIAYALRHKGPEGEGKRQKEYRQLLQLTRQILNDSCRVLQEVEALPPRRRRGVRELGERLEAMADQVRRVARQAKARVLAGLTQFPNKLLSLFEPHTEIIRKGKAGKPNEFGGWWSCRKRRTRSSRITKYSRSGPVTGIYCFRPWKHIGGSWAGFRDGSRLMLVFTHGRMKKPPGVGREVCFDSEPEHAQCRAAPTAEAALVQAWAEVPDGM